MGKGRSRQGGSGGSVNSIGDDFVRGNFRLSEDEFKDLEDSEEASYAFSSDGQGIEAAVKILEDIGFDVVVDPKLLKENEVKEVIEQAEIKKITEKTFMKHFNGLFGDIVNSGDSARYKYSDIQDRFSGIMMKVYMGTGGLTPAEKKFAKYVEDLPIAVIHDIFNDIAFGKSFGYSRPEILTGREKVSRFEIIDHSDYNNVVITNAKTAARMLKGLVGELDKVSGLQVNDSLKLQQVKFSNMRVDELAFYNDMTWVTTKKEKNSIEQTMGGSISMTSVLTKGEKSGKNTGHNIGVRAKAIAAHEFGHYIQNVLEHDKRDIAKSLKGDARIRYEYFSTFTDNKRNYGMSKEARAYGDSFSSSVSVYGNKNHLEAFAEATCAYIMGVKPTNGTEYYSEYKKFMKDAGLSRLEGVGKNII